MSKKKKRQHRPKKPPKGQYHARGPRQPLNLTGKVDPAQEIKRLRRDAEKAGVPELLTPSEEAFATMPEANIHAARRVLDAAKLGATPLVDPAAVFDLAHLAMSVQFGIDIAEDDYKPVGEAREWLLDLCERCGLDVDATGARLRFTYSDKEVEQYAKVATIAIRRLALIGA